MSQERAAEVVALDDALNQLEQIDPQQGRIVELRFFGGLTIEQTAEALHLSPATIKREWEDGQSLALSRIGQRVSAMTPEHWQRCLTNFSLSFSSSPPPLGEGLGERG